jgi:hypothetical protein
MFRYVDDGKLLETANLVQRRINEAFPGSSLSEIAKEVVTMTDEAVPVARSIRQPNWWLRGGLILLPIVLVLAVWLAFRGEQAAPGDHPPTMSERILKAMDATKGGAVYICALFVFLFTLEVRWKRWTAFKAVHVLRGMAHLIDMHQLVRDPQKLRSPDANDKSSWTAEGMDRYLRHSIELLALVSKIAHLYVQGLADSGAHAAVDGCESLITGLSQKIWQKRVILDRMQSDTTGRDGPRVTSVTPAAAPARAT